MFCEGNVSLLVSEEEGFPRHVKRKVNKYKLKILTYVLVL